MPFLNLENLTPFVIPVLIFVARVVDVSMETVRIICLSRGVRKIAAAIGFVEKLIWLVAVVQIMKHLDNVFNYVAFAGGFSMGNFVGVAIEKKIALGSCLIRIIVKNESDRLVSALRKKSFGVTTVEAYGASGPSTIILVAAKRRALPQVKKIINQFAPRTFFTVEDVRYVREGSIPQIYKSDLCADSN